MNKLKLILLALLPAVLLVGGCQEETPPDPGTVAFYQKKVETERRRREEAQLTAEAEAGRRKSWELAAAGLGILRLAGFVAGTALGSKGRRDARTQSA